MRTLRTLRVATAGIALLAMAMAVCVSHAAENCDQVLQKTGRDFDNEQYFNAVASHLYEQTCSGSSSKSNSSGALDVGVVVNSLPLKFGASGSSQSEKVSNFCHTYDNLFTSNSSSIKVTSTVVGNSVNAWLACKRIGGGVDFDTNIQDTLFSVTAIRTNPALNVEIKSVVIDSKLASCTFTRNGTLKEASLAMQEVMSNNDTRLTISCIRKPQQEADGSTTYPAIDFQLDTSLGTFALPLQPNTSMPVRWASELAQQLAELKRGQADTNGRVSKVVAGSPNCLGHGWVGRGAVAPATNETECPRGSFAAGIGFKHNFGENFTFQESFEVFCCPLSGS